MKKKHRNKRVYHNKNKYGVRVKGGITFDPETKMFHSVIHVWDNSECLGNPKEYSSKEAFDTEEEAFEHYKEKVRPTIMKIQAEMEKDGSEVITKNPWDDGWVKT